MKNYAIITENNIIKGVLTIHLEDVSIEDFEIEKDETDKVLFISNINFENYENLLLTKQEHEVLFYDIENEVIQLKNSMAL